MDFAPIEASQMTSDRPDCHLVCIPPDKTALVWPLARHLIYAAMKRGDLSSFASVEGSVLRGDALLWLAVGREDDDGVRIHAAAATELHQTEWRKVCVVVACGAPSEPASRAAGSGVDASRASGMRRWIRLLEGIEDFARAEGCSATRIMGRPGWARVLTSYQAKRIVLEKDL